MKAPVLFLLASSVAATVAFVACSSPTTCICTQLDAGACTEPDAAADAAADGEAPDASDGGVGDGSSDSAAIDAGPTIAPYPRMFVGSLHTCIADARRIGCVGWNYYGQLGNGQLQRDEDQDSRAFAINPLASDFMSGTGNFTHSCFITAPGDVSCMGDDRIGAVGSHAGPVTRPQKVAGISGVKVIDSGKGFNCAIAANDQVLCWGWNAHGELGNGSNDEFNPTPTPVQNLGPAKALAVGDSHACAVLKDGSVWCWGETVEAFIVKDEALNTHVPIQIAPAGSADSIAAGVSFTCIVKDGAVRCLGDNQYGTLGTFPDVPYSRTFVPVTGVSDVRAITVGNSHTCVSFGAAGSVACWGNNDLGQTGLGGQGTVRIPALVTTPAGETKPLSSVVELSAQYNHTCAKTAGGRIFCWGDNSHAQLATGATVPPFYTQPIELKLP
jgi:alpha-tubulin suppressor-like RCC1 family protein